MSVIGRPAKTADVLKSEGKSHRTKEELEARQNAEKSLLTRRKIRKFPEVAKNDIANKEFNRVKKLLEALGKNDDLYSNIINRYCLLKAECNEFEEKRERFYKDLAKAETALETDEIDLKEYLRLSNAIQRNIIDMDKQIQSKRKMMFDIEKESLMTVSSALRSIPKKPEIDPEQKAFLAFIQGREND